MRFHTRGTLGDVIYRVTGDTFAFQTYFHHGMVTALISLLTLASMTVVMLQMNVALTLASLLVMPALVAVMQVFSKRMTQRSLRTHEAESALTSQVHQVMSALPLVRAYVCEDEEERKFSTRSNATVTVRLAQHRVEILYWLGIALVIGAGTAAITWLGGLRVLNGQLSVGVLIVFLAYLGMLLTMTGAAMMFCLIKLDFCTVVTPLGEREKVFIALKPQRFAPLFQERFEKLIGEFGGNHSIAGILQQPVGCFPLSPGENAGVRADVPPLNQSILHPPPSILVSDSRGRLAFARQLPRFHLRLRPRFARAGQTARRALQPGGLRSLSAGRHPAD